MGYAQIGQTGFYPPRLFRWHLRSHLDSPSFCCCAEKMSLTRAPCPSVGRYSKCHKLPWWAGWEERFPVSFSLPNLSVFRLWVINGGYWWLLQVVQQPCKPKKGSVFFLASWHHPAKEKRKSRDMPFELRCRNWKRDRWEINQGKLSRIGANKIWV